MSRFLVVVAVATACLTLAGPAFPATRDSQLSYADFMKVPPDQRDREFAALPADNRAAIMRQHFERWLEVHRPDLSHNAQTLVREAIDLISPELYSAPPSDALRERQAQLGQRLACAIGSERSGTLNKVGIVPQRIDQTWRESTREWVDWLVNCAGR
jgi:hypothetical protein